ncbi:MAG: hypothetical protein LBL42_05965 [Tannerella sp.]|jgi:hypothetical protein|nr:hypothetical protein [Tannerella sp.]
MDKDKKKIVQSVVKLCTDKLDLKQQLPGEYYYSSLPLCVINCVFSIAVRYEAVTNTVSRFCKYYNIKQYRNDKRTVPPIEEQVSVTRVLEYIRNFDGKHEQLAINVFGNRQRTSPSHGILKAEAVVRFLKILKRYEVDYFQDLEKITVKAENQIRRIPGQVSGISLAYFFMLCGNENYIKPDRMIVSFIQDACPSFRPNNAECQEIMTEVARELNSAGYKITPRRLDFIIWDFQRLFYSEKMAKKAFLEESAQRMRENAFAEEFVNRILPNLTMYYRDAELEEDTVSKYRAGQIICERAFVDASSYAGKLTKSCRFVIASSQAKSLCAFGADAERWTLHVISSNSYFKVLDIYRKGNKTQILLFHIPAGGIDFFKNKTLTVNGNNIEASIIEKARAGFDRKMEMLPAFALEEEEWIKRTDFPLGMNNENQFFPLT